MIETTRSWLYLYRHASSVADYLTWTGRGEVYEAAYLPEDRAPVLRLTSECQDAESARIAGFWLDRQPDAFHLQRRAETGEVVAFSAWLRLYRPGPDEIAADPVIAAVWRHCAMHGPPRTGEHIAVSRFTVDADACGSTSPAVDLKITRVVAEWLRAHRMAWSFLVLLDIEAWDIQSKSVEHQPISERVTVGDSELVLYSHDWRTMPLQLWMSRQDTEVLSGHRTAAAAKPSRHVLARPQFDAAVRAALRHVGHDAALDANPLCGTVLADTGHELSMVVTEAVQMLADDPRAAKQYRAVHTTYFLPVPTQEAAAQQLGLPFSTYRRHLASGIKRICESLWNWELNT